MAQDAFTKFKTGAIITGAVLVLGAVAFFGGTTKIPAGFDGVVYSQISGLQPDALKTGRHIVYPWQTVYEYPTSTETVSLAKDSEKDNSFWQKTNDGKSVNIDAIYQYHIDPNKLSEVYGRFRGQSYTAIEAGKIKQAVQQVSQEVLSNYSVFDTYKKAAEINVKFLEGMHKQLDGSGIVIETASLKRIEPDKATEDAIQSQVNAEMAIKTKELEKQQAQVDADKVRIAAQGSADAKVIAAEGEAKANEAIKKSITQGNIDYMYAQAAQELAKHYSPQVVAGGNGGSILNIPSLQPKQ